MAILRFPGLLASCALACLLTACGGGGGGGGGFIDDGGVGGPGGGGGDATVFNLELELTDADGNPESVMTSARPLTLTVTAREGNRPAEGEVVTLTAENVLFTPESGSQLTNADGIAIFELASNGTTGAGTLTASVGDASESVNFEVVSSISMTLTDVAGNPITTITDSIDGVITVTLTDGDPENPEPQAGQIIEVTTSNGTVSPATSLTDDNGEAVFTLEADGGSGAGTITAQWGSDSVFLNFQIVSVSAGVNSLALELTDPDGVPTNNVTSVNPATLTVTATDPLGQPLANEILTASATIGEITPESGTALTDLSGIATFRIEAGQTLGAGTVEVQLGEVTESVNFQVGEANLRIGRIDDDDNFVQGEIDAAATSLPAAGSTSLTVAVVDSDGELVPTTVAVTFSSGCANLVPPEAEITGQANTVNGIATSTYTADGCTGTDIITAAIVQGNTQTATVSLDIATADVNSVSFISAEPTTIALKGTGGEGRQETAAVEFQVLDSTGAPVAGYDVALSLSTTVGGLSLTNDTATTNEQGIARAIVQAGNVSTSVRVTATILVDGQELSTVSDRLVISTGLPDQNSVSLVAETLNPGGGTQAGITTQLTVRMADKFNNPVPDGTAAFFTTEYGSIESSCETTGGACSVTWTSQSPRAPLIYNNSGSGSYLSTLNNRVCANTGNTGSPCQTDGTIEGSAAVGFTPIFRGRSTVLVTALGEESFVDSNGNGVYDSGEAFDDLAEAWVDNNENRDPGLWRDDTANNGTFADGGYDGDDTCTPTDASETGRECASGLEETFVDFNVDGVFTSENGLYNGTLCPEALAASGDCSRSLVNVRDDVTLVMSSNDDVRIAVLEDNGGGGADVEITAIPDSDNTETRLVLVSDFFNNIPPADTTISVSSDACEIISDDSLTVPDTNFVGPYAFYVTIIRSLVNTEFVSGFITIEVTPPNGATVTYAVTCNDP